MSLPQLQGYKIHRQMAAGGMAKIYDATQISLNRPVAIKFLSRSLLEHHEAISLFEHESLIIAQLNHPNIVQVIDKGITDDSQPYFVMEKINGVDLSEVISGAELPYSKKIDIAIQVCKGLAYAHKNSVIHRDIKPANIIIDHHGNAKILDFGIALSENAEKDNSGETSVIGTHGYIAPEQEDNYAQATITSDIYSFGIVLKHLFSQSITSNQPLKDKIKELPKALAELINKATAVNPKERFSSLSEVRDQLLSISQGSHLTKSNLEEAQKDTQDLNSQFNLLDILRKSRQKSVYLFQKKSNQQLLVIKRQLGNYLGLKQAKILSSLKHPNIVQIYAAGKSNGNFVLITEYLTGGSLANQLLQDMSQQEFLTQACQICSAIHFAHQNNIQHNNLSPENILFDSKKNIKVGDFGQTRTNIDAPELIERYHPPGQQAFSEQYDIYCMGAVFHHMLYGVPAGESPRDRKEKLSFKLQKLIDSMLSIDPINRPTTAQQVLIELQKIARGKQGKNKRSKIAESRQKETVKTTRKKPQIARKPNEEKPKGLIIALSVSIALIIILLLKDMV